MAAETITSNSNLYLKYNFRQKADTVGKKKVKKYSL